jgi:hypothetical protein
MSFPQPFRLAVPFWCWLYSGTVSIPTSRRSCATVFLPPRVGYSWSYDQRTNSGIRLHGWPESPSKCDLQQRHKREGKIKILTPSHSFLPFYHSFQHLFTGFQPLGRIFDPFYVYTYPLTRLQHEAPALRQKAPVSSKKRHFQPKSRFRLSPSFTRRLDVFSTTVNYPRAVLRV